MDLRSPVPQLPFLTRGKGGPGRNVLPRVSRLSQNNIQGILISCPGLYYVPVSFEIHLFHSLIQIVFSRTQTVLRSSKSLSSRKAKRMMFIRCFENKFPFG